MAYAEWVKKDPRFSSIFIQVSPCLHHHAFPRLKLRYKPSLVQVEGGTAHLPVTDLSIRAEPLTPQQWREKLKARAIVGTTDSSRLKRVLLLDVRNGTSKFPSLFSPPWSHCNLKSALLHFISIQYVICYMAIETALFCFFSLPPSTNTAVLPGS
jgi:hypothetical protein